MLQSHLKRSRVLLLFFLIFLAGCVNHEGERSNEFTDNLYFDYRITGEEDRDAVSCMLQFKWGGQEGGALALREPGSVALDGETLPRDSARLTGVYYEVEKPLESFAGKHEIVLTDHRKKQYREEFGFAPFGLEELDEQIVRRPFVIKLKDFPAKATRVHLILVDTAFETNDVNEMLSIVNGELPVTEEMLRRLKSGPVSLEIYSEEERPLKQRSRMGGKIFIQYGLKREFQLTDDN
jgi:hypothetical protein